jgi:hypothetical protein
MTYIEELRLETNRMVATCFRSRNRIKGLIAQYHLKSNGPRKDYRALVNLLKESRKIIRDTKKPIMNPSREPAFYEKCIEELIRYNGILELHIDEIIKLHAPPPIVAADDSGSFGPATITFSNPMNPMLFKYNRRQYPTVIFGSWKPPIKKRTIQKWQPPGTMQMPTREDLHDLH